MNSVTIEVTGSNSAAVDEATAGLLEGLADADIDVTPAPTGGERDGGIVAIAIAIAGGAASIAQVASTIHAMSKKKDVHIVIIDRSGARLAVDPSNETAEMRALIERASAEA